MGEGNKNRILYYDVIRAVACLSVLIIHFNASFSAWSGGVFTYPNAVFPNNIFNNSVYLGDFGVSLFFILSGAAMFRTYGEREISLGAFYRKRFLSLYPMFWLAWFAAAAVGALVYGGIGSGGVGALLATASGMDGYLMSLGYGGLGAFYKVGEWFLGCMILLYLIIPLLLRGMKKHPLLTLGLSIAVSILLHGKTLNIFFLRRVPEVVFGMAFDRYFRPQRGKARAFWIVGTLVGILVLSAAGPKIVPAGYGLEACVGICALTFLLLTLLFQDARDARLIRPVSWIARYSYPIFLIHHQVCDYMAKRFYLPDLPKGTLYFAFLVYLTITALLAVLLARTSRAVVGWFKSFAPQREEEQPKNFRERWLRGLKDLPAAALIPIQFFGVIPLQLYLANAGDMKAPLGAVILYCGVFFLLSLAGLTLVGMLLSDKGFVRWQSVLFAGGVLLYLQSNFLFIKLGILSGEAFDLSRMQGRMKADALLWVAGIAAVVFLSWRLPAILEKVTRYGSGLLLAMQALVLVLMFVLPRQGGSPTASERMVTTKGFNELSRDKNAVIFILDMYDDTYMTEVLEKNPDLVQRLDGFTRYTNITGKYPSTAYGMPFVVTQQPLLNQGGNYRTMLDQAYANSEMLNTLIEEGYRIQLYTYNIPDSFQEHCYNVEESQYVVSDPALFSKLMVKLTLLRGGPDILKNSLSLSTDQFDQVVSAQQGELHTTDGILPYQKMQNEEIQVVEEPVFSVIHIRGTHPPYEINENGQQVETGSVTCYEQALGTLRTVLAYLEHMKNAGVYDNSTVIITADHGYNDTNGPISSPALLVKQRDSRGDLRLDNSPVSQDNIQDFVLSDAVEGYQAAPRTGPRVFYSYIFDASNYFPLTEWYVSDESNKLESFSPSGYQYDREGNRVPLAKYTPYSFGEIMTFPMEGEANNYFDYGIGSAAYGPPHLVGRAGEFSFSHEPAVQDMLFTLGLENHQESEMTISLLCDGQDCGSVTLGGGQNIARWKIPADYMSEEKTRLTLRYEGLEQDWCGISTGTYYDYWVIDKYQGEELSQQQESFAPLEDYQARILFSEFSGDDLLVKVQNTSSSDWNREARVRCCIRIEGEDSGIRAYLPPSVTVTPGEEITLCFTEVKNAYTGSTVQVQMLQEGITYFGEIREVDWGTGNLKP